MIDVDRLVGGDSESSRVGALSCRRLAHRYKMSLNTASASIRNDAGWHQKHEMAPMHVNTPADVRLQQHCTVRYTVGDGSAEYHKIHARV